MKKTKFIRFLSLILCTALIAAVALTCIGCNGNNTANEGEKEFTLVVTHANGEEKSFNVKTDKATVGDALLEEGLISGSEGSYGLMIETVDGETVTFDKDGKYWAFYIGEEYAMTGVDSTDITDGQEYALKVEE